MVGPPEPEPTTSASRGVLGPGSRRGLLGPGSDGDDDDGSIYIDNYILVMVLVAKIRAITCRMIMMKGKKPKGTRQKLLSGFCPLRGYPPPS